MIDYISKVPPYESQYSATTHSDMQDCVEESFCHIVYMLTGFRASPRALAYMTDVQPTGSSVTQCLAVVNAKGLIPYDLWPTPDSFTWESYYTPIPQNILDQVIKIEAYLAPPSLETSPLWTELEWNSSLPIPTRHMVAQINDTQYFDSEIGAAIKPIDYEGAKIVYQTSLKVKLNQMQLIKDNGVVYIVSGVNNKTKLGIADPTTLALFGDEPIIEGDTSAIPESYTIAQGFIINKK